MGPVRHPSPVSPRVRVAAAVRRGPPQAFSSSRLVLGPRHGVHGCPGVKGNPRFVRGILRRGLDALEAAEAAFERHRYALVVSLAQQACELSLKAALRFAAIDPPRQHDVGELLAARARRFPRWFRGEVPFLRESSELLTRLREPATYGSPSADRAPAELFADPSAASDALERAKRVCAVATRLIGLEEKPSHADADSGRT